MEISKVNTQTIIDNLRLEGHTSRAEYVELLMLRIEELEAAQQKDVPDLALPAGHSGSSLECTHPSCGKEYRN